MKNEEYKTNPYAIYKSIMGLNGTSLKMYSTAYMNIQADSSLSTGISSFIYYIICIFYPACQSSRGVRPAIS
jgi:hypothetical protein